MANIDNQIHEIRRKLAVEQKCREGGQLMRTQLTDKNAIAQCDISLLESQKRIDFLQSELQKLQLRKQDAQSAERQASHLDQKEYHIEKLNSTGQRPASILSALDLRKSDSTLSTEKVSFKLHEIAFKLDVERKVKEGTNKLNDLYSSNPTMGDKQSRTDIAEKLAESNEKILLLQRALQNYQGLSFGVEGDKESQVNNRRVGGLRRPLTGNLYLRIMAARHLAHAGSSRTNRQLETSITIKVDGVMKGRTKYTRNDRWYEDFTINIDKGHEVELIFYDRLNYDALMPIGLCWFRLVDLNDAIRRKQLGADNQVGPRRLSGPSPATTSVSSPRASESANSIVHSLGENAASPGQLPDGICSWWDVEPVGQVEIKLSFAKSTGKARQISKLGRQGAVRKRKGVAHEQNGHQFIVKQFYQLIKCSLCEEFLRNTIGCQCEECKLACHKKCYPKVVTKCISKASNEVDRDEEKLNHSIPHRFEASTNLSAHWCCHCGYLLPLGKRSIVRCSECNTTAHPDCGPLVPNFCGMSMETANRILSEIKAAKQRSSDRRSMLDAESLAISPGKKTAVGSRTPARDSRTTSTLVPPGKKSGGLDDFKFLAVLGKGNFGKVMLSEEIATKNLYAIKVLKKEFVIKNDEVESTKSEKRVFQAANQERHPFLVGLHSCFQTETRIYFVMEYINGGDLMWHIQQEQFSERRAKFYACEVLLALEYFHRKNIIYRDLKLDNILLGLDGHIKIADYGLCKEKMGYGATTNTFCGTPEFMAPEILLEERYGKAVDWWAFGVLIYEMLLGQSPFRGDDEDEIFDAILEDDILYPINMPHDSVSILQQLLQRDPNRRLGAGPEDAGEIKKHAFFSNVNWEDFLQKKVKPPYVPTIHSREDTSNFDSEFTKEPPVLTPTNNLLTNAEQAEFRGFTYVADWVGTVN